LLTAAAPSPGGLADGLAPEGPGHAAQGNAVSVVVRLLEAKPGAMKLLLSDAQTDAPIQAEVEVSRDGARVSAHIARMGSVICEITGTVTETRENYEMEKTDFWLKLSPSCEEAGVLDQDPLLVYGEKTERTRLHESIEGELILKEAPLDPIADLVVRRMVDLNWTERASTQVGRVIGPVPRAGVEPFIHQRYDDLSVLGAKR